jgi:hypothetical protein
MVKPFTILETKKKRNPLINKVNKPKVKIFKGRVTNIKNGRRKTLIIPNTKATVITERRLDISMPFII